MDGSINQTSTVKDSSNNSGRTRKKGSSGSGSHHKSASSSQEQQEKKLNGEHHDDITTIISTSNGDNKSPRKSSSAPQITNGNNSTTKGTTTATTVSPPSPTRILNLKKQLEKQERNHQKSKLTGIKSSSFIPIINNGSSSSSNGSPSTSNIVVTSSITSTSSSQLMINRLESLDEEEEELPSSLDLQQHYQIIDQYPCTLSRYQQYNTTTQSANNSKRSSNMKNRSRSSTINEDEDEEVKTKTNRMTWFKQLKLYLNSLRPRTFTPSLASVTLGAVLAWKATGNFDLLIFIVSCLTVLAVHGAGNLVNTYYDFVKGIDRSTQSVNQCPYRTLVDHQLSIDQVVHLGVIAYMFGCFGFVCLVFLSPARMEHLALVYFCGISCSFLYTGGLGLKYIGLGDILIMVIFGPISILFSFMSQSGYIDPVTVLFALPLAFHTEAILHSNNTRDIESDQRAGAVTLAILIGPTFCHIVYALLLFMPYIMLIVSIIHYSIVFVIPLITITKAFQLEKKFRSGHLNDIPSATASLHLIFSISYIISCCIIHPDNLPLLQHHTVITNS